MEENYCLVNDIVEFNNNWINVINWYGNRFEKNIVLMRLDNILNKSVFYIFGIILDENIRNIVIFIKKLK